jgi:hypothetical protein
MVGLIAVEPDLATAMASLAITPIGAPLLLGWDATTNRRLLVGYGLVIGTLALITGFGWMSVDQRIDLASLVAMCCAVGVLVGNLLQGLRMRSIEQALELRRLNRELHGYATTDPLTRLRNRRQLDGDVAIIWPSIRRGARCAVVMLDLDRFKRLNDERGHAAGDHAPRRSRSGSATGPWPGQRLSCRRRGILVLLRDTTWKPGSRSPTGFASRSPISRCRPPAGHRVANDQRWGGRGRPGLRHWDAVVALPMPPVRGQTGGPNRVFGPDGVEARAA